MLTIDLSCLYFIRNLFPEIAELKWQVFQDKKVDSFDTHTHARMHIHNLEFSVDYGVQPPLIMLEFDSRQILLCLLLCYVLLAHQLFF